MKKTIQILAFSAAFLALTCGVQAEMVTLEPSDDMFTDVEHPVLDHPVDELWVADFDAAGQYQRIMIQFDMEALAGATINSATLHLHRFFGCPSGGPTNVDFYAVTSEWNDETWPGDQHAEYDAEARANYVFNVNGEHTIDLTTLVQAWASGDVENHGVLMRARQMCKWSKFYSSECADQALRPTLVVDYATSDVNEEGESCLPTETLVAYPNPFNPETTISYSLMEGETVNLVVFNTLGQRVRELAKGRQDAGIHRVTFSGNDLPAGMYIVQLSVGDTVAHRRVLLLK